MRSGRRERWKERGGVEGEGGGHQSDLKGRFKRITTCDVDLFFCLNM